MDRFSSVSPRTSAGYIPWWLLAGVAGFFGLTALTLGGWVWLTRGAEIPIPTATPMIVIVPPTIVVATPTVQAPPTAVLPEPSATPADLAASIKIGDYVQVTGTAPQGTLNMRAEPNLGSPVNYVALEREVLQVQAGPQISNDYTWWYLVDPATGSRSGWAVQNYLLVVQGP